MELDDFDFGSFDEFAYEPDPNLSLPIGFFRITWALQTSRIDGYRNMIRRIRKTEDVDPLEDYDPGYALTSQEPYKAAHMMRELSEEFISAERPFSKDSRLFGHLCPSYPIVPLIGRPGGVNAQLFDMFNRGREYYTSLPAYLADAHEVEVSDEIMDLSPITPMLCHEEESEAVINF